MAPMTDADSSDEPDDETKMSSLSETQIALALRHAPDEAFTRQIEAARDAIKANWGTSRPDDLAKVKETDHYELDDLGWEIYDDFGADPAVRMVIVTPVPDWGEPEYLEEITREFVREMKQKTMAHIEAMQRKTRLTPTEFTALMVDIVGDGEIQEYSQPLGRSTDQITTDLYHANGILEQAEAVVELAGSPAITYSANHRHTHDEDCGVFTEEVEE